MRRFAWSAGVQIGLAVFAAGGITLSVVGCSAERRPVEAAAPSNGSPSSEDGLPAVGVLTPQQGLMERTTTQPATVHANFQAEIYAKVAGYLTDLRVDIGQKMQAGQVLGIISVPEMDKEYERQQKTVEQLQAQERQKQAGVELARANLESAQAVLEETKAGIQKAEAQLTADRAQYERVKELVAQDSVTRRLLDESRGRYEASLAAKTAAQAAVTSAQAQVTVSQAQLTAAEADLFAAQAATAVAQKKLEETEALLSYATLKAPLTGVVTQRHVDPGDLVRNIETASDPSRDPLFTIAQTETVRLRTTVPERDAPFVDVGDAATIHLQALPGSPYEAKVSRTSGSLDTGTQTLLVEIDVPNEEGKILPGMYGEATIALESKSDALVLPADVVRHDTEGHSYVFVVGGDNTLRKTDVSIGIDTGTQVEIVSGLDGSERVVDATVDNLEEGQKVRVR